LRGQPVVGWLSERFVRDQRVSDRRFLDYSRTYVRSRNVVTPDTSRVGGAAPARV
jgi:hypothetical protein